MTLNTIIIENANNIKYKTVLFLSSLGGLPSTSRASGLTNTQQHNVIKAIEIIKGRNIIFINSSVGILNFEYKKRFCGFPKGVSIPPRFAAMFCIIKVKAIYFSFLVVVSTKYPSGKKVKSAMSLAMSIEPINVINISVKMQIRAFFTFLTIFCATV